MSRKHRYCTYTDERKKNNKCDELITDINFNEDPLMDFDSINIEDDVGISEVDFDSKMKQYPSLLSLKA